MKNRELKERFLEETYNNPWTIATYMSIFRNLGKYEDKIDKEFAEMNQKELEGYFRDPSSGRSETLTMRFSIFRAYAKWFHKITGIANPFLENLSTRDFRDLFKDKTIYIEGEPISRDMVLKIVRAVPNPRDRAIILGVFEGIGGSGLTEFFEIRPEDVQDNSIFIRQRNRLVRVSKELIDIFRQAMKTQVYTDILDPTKKYPLIDKDSVAIGIPDGLKNTQRSTAYVVRKIAMVLGLPESFTLTNLRFWGMGQLIADRAMRDGISAKKSWSRYRDDLLIQFNVSRMKKDKVIFLAESLMELKGDEEIG